MNIRKKLFVLLVTMILAHLTNAQTQTCASFNTSSTALTRLQPANTNEHKDGSHSWGITPVFGCTYSHGNSANCDTECTVTSVGATSFDPIGGFLSVENGTLSSFGTHMVSGTWAPADSKAFGAGLSCTGTVAAAAANCFAAGGTCFINVSLSAGGVSVNTNGTTVWNSGPVPASVTCPAKADPQATPTPPPPPPPDPTPTPCSSDGEPTPLTRSGDPGDTNNPCASPIIIDTSGNGYRLTSAANGVLFDIAGTGTPMRLGWTQPGSGNAFLVLPRSDGSVTNGQQLFGNFTPQPPSATPNGYAALAVYDHSDHGGNGDGVIDQNDQIFSSLRLWLDENHDGVCQPEELYTLPQLGVFSISLDYSLSERTDDFGNLFRYKARINQGSKDDSVGRKAYDIFFVRQ